MWLLLAWARGLALVSIHLAYKCRWRAGVSSTPRCCNIVSLVLVVVGACAAQEVREVADCVLERRGGVGDVAVEVVDGEVDVCAVGVGAVPEVADLFWVGV